MVGLNITFSLTLSKGPSSPSLTYKTTLQIGQDLEFQFCTGTEPRVLHQNSYIRWYRSNRRQIFVATVPTVAFTSVLFHIIISVRWDSCQGHLSRVITHLTVTPLWMLSLVWTSHLIWGFPRKLLMSPQVMEMLRSQGDGGEYLQRNTKHTFPRVRSLQSEWLWSNWASSLVDAQVSGISSGSGSSETCTDNWIIFTLKPASLDKPPSRKSSHKEKYVKSHVNDL